MAGLSRREVTPDALGRTPGRGPALLEAGLLLVAVVAVFAPNPHDLVTGTWSQRTIYPVWVVAFPLAGVVAALVPLRKPAWTAQAQVVVAVLAATVAGQGLVAWKHWEPAGGMSGVSAGADPNVSPEAMAWTLAAVSIAAAATAMVVLVRAGEFPVARSAAIRTQCIGAAAGIAILIPIGLGLEQPENRDLTSIGAYLLAYVLPWGMTLAATAFVRRELAVVALATGLVVIVVVWIAPPMVDLVLGNGHRVGVGAAAAFYIGRLSAERRDRTA